MERKKESLNIRYWLTVAFSAPAALALLSKLDERLNFGPLLERVILNFNLISKWFWNFIGNIINVDLSEIHGQLSFLVLVFGAMLRYGSKSAVSPRDKNSVNFVDPFSLAILFMVLVSSKEDDFYPNILFLIPLCLLFTFSQIEKNIPPILLIKVFKNIVYNFYISVLIIVICAILFNYYFSGGNASHVVSSVFAVTATVVYKVVIPEKYVFTKIVVFAFGIYIIDFISNFLLPLVNDKLDSLGA